MGCKHGRVASMCIDCDLGDHGIVLPAPCGLCRRAPGACVCDPMTAPVVPGDRGAPAVAKGEARCDAAEMARLSDSDVCQACGDGWERHGKTCAGSHEPAPVAAREPSADEVVAVARALETCVGAYTFYDMARAAIRALDEIRRGTR